MKHTYEKPKTDWMRKLPLKQLAIGVYAEQCRYIGWDHGGICSDLILAALEEAQRQQREEDDELAKQFGDKLRREREQSEPDPSVCHLCGADLHNGRSGTYCGRCDG